MSDEGYIAVKQGEERNYGTVGMADEEQPRVGETADAQVRRDVCLTPLRQPEPPERLTCTAVLRVVGVHS